MLVLNPDKRISAENALHHKYFTSNPLPNEITSMFKFDTEHRVREIKLEIERLDNLKKEEQNKKKMIDLVKNIVKFI